MSMYQKCPVCEGTGLVSRPPWVAGDQDCWVSSSTGPYTCRACNGQGIIMAPENIKIEGRNNLDRWEEMALI